jgi:hypothetical protein
LDCQQRLPAFPAASCQQNDEEPQSRSEKSEGRGGFQEQEKQKIRGL